MLNKYRLAYNRIVEACAPNKKVIDDLVLFNELVDKETPRYPKIFKEEWGNEVCCPRCKEYLEGEEPYRCSNCGQRINWAIEDD